MSFPEALLNKSGAEVRRYIDGHEVTRLSPVESGVDLLTHHPLWVEKAASSLRRLPVATILLILITVIAAIVGGIVVITNPQTLAFAAYLNDLKVLAIGLGLLAVGRGQAARKG